MDKKFNFLQKVKNNRDAHLVTTKIRKTAPTKTGNSFQISFFFYQRKKYCISRQLHLNDCFSPPEKLDEKKKLGIGSDIYSLASTLYVLVTGELPLASNLRNIQKIQTPKQLNPSLSDRFNDAILAGMNLELKQRPQYLKDWLDLFDIA